MKERVRLLVNAGADALVVDTAHGHSKGVLDMIKYIKRHYKNMQVVAGNIATGEAAKALIKAGADALKVGIGPGSICTTRIVAGTGVPQLSAIMDVVKVAEKSKVPVIADGGIKYSGDAAKAFAVGATSCMMGSLLAGTSEAPGDMFYGDDGKAYKNYRGMGSLGAMSKGGKERYGQAGVATNKFVPEGIEGKILYKGNVNTELHQLSGGVRSAMGYSGAKDLKVFKKRAKLVQITSASLRESHPHDVVITKQAPNYRG
jgi:IMP dehydrogenase